MAVYLLDFGKLTINNAQVIIEINEGVHLDIEKARQLWAAIRDNVGDSPFVYISHRVNSYSVDPMAYQHIREAINLVGFVFITKPSNARTVEVEKLFIKDFMTYTCSNLEQALGWSQQQLQAIA